MKRATRVAFLSCTRHLSSSGQGLANLTQVQMVDNVKVQSLGDETAYTISSTDLDGVHSEMALRYNPARGGEIRFTNSSVTWRRHSPETAEKH
ncbi:MAG: hypothetical protein LAO09_00415 [Acidobacteriia bacterium]|nr:hypothetical protein [Terriglobia bacterium]